MRPVAIVLVVVAALAAAITAFLAKRWVEAQSRPPAETAQLTEVLVAAREVPAGSTIEAADLRYDRWPHSAVRPGLVVRLNNDDPKAKYVGQVTRRALAEAEPFAESTVVRHDAAGVLAGMLSPGMRAVSIAITNASGVSGFITPGDRVDVVLAADVRKADRQDKDNGPILRFAAETVLEDVKVLAIDQQIARGRDGSAIQGKTATVEVSPKQAELLTAAGMLGNLSLVLRGFDAAGGPQRAAQQPATFTPDLEASKALQALHGPKAKPKGPSSPGGGVQVIRGGQVSTQSVSP